MARVDQRVFFEDVEPGAALPDREFGPHTLVAAIQWAGVQENPSPTHTDRDAARAMRGLKTVIASGALREAYLARMLMDWAGPLGDLRRMSLRHTASTFEGDLMRFAARVVEKSPSSADPWVVCEFTGTNQDGVRIVEGRCTISLPRRTAAPTGAG
ncbi:MAG TPA: MaoC/PaaZ C-terminal domain-containing protein [Chloroflexota bacterium]|nr:MaoC/PaaZ C-terminal domain-containing protein [Chloroflexota bacterium]